MFTGQRYHCLALEKINVLKVSPSKQHYILGKLTPCAHRRKTNAARAKGSSLAASSIQHYRKIYAHNTVCLQSGRAQGILYVKSYLSNSSVQSVLIVSVHTFKTKKKRRRRRSSRGTHTGGTKSLMEMRNILWSNEWINKCERAHWNMHFHAAAVCSAYKQSSVADDTTKAITQWTDKTGMVWVRNWSLTAPKVIIYNITSDYFHKFCSHWVLFAPYSFPFYPPRDDRFNHLDTFHNRHIHPENWTHWISRAQHCPRFMR